MKQRIYYVRNPDSMAWRLRKGYWRLRRVYWDSRSLIQKWKAIRNAPLIMLISERSVIHNMNLEDLTWTPDEGGGGVVTGVHFISQHQIPGKYVIHVPQGGLVLLEEEDTPQ